MKGNRRILVKDGMGNEKEYLIPKGKHVNVHEGDWVTAGEPLMDGPVDPHDILNVLGPRELQKYLVDEVQQVYRLQGVSINDKHIEVIVRQMLRKVRIEDAGDTAFLIGEQVDRFSFARENEAVIGRGGRYATAKPILLGITKASLTTDSFISAASFQETTRVLTEAAITGSIDDLVGLKRTLSWAGSYPPARVCPNTGTPSSRWRRKQPPKNSKFTERREPLSCGSRFLFP